MDKDTIQSTINKLVDIIDEEQFLNIINDATIDRYVKKFTIYRFFLMCIIAQLQSEPSLGSLAGYQKNNPDFQSLVGFESISKSQLSRKQSDLPSAHFETVFNHLVTAVQMEMKNTPQFRDVGQLRAIDSTTMSMSFSQYPWATFRRTKAGVRLHLSVMVTKDLTIPDKAILTDAKQADRSQMGALVEMDSDAIQLFDRAIMTTVSLTRYVRTMRALSQNSRKMPRSRYWTRKRRIRTRRSLPTRQWCWDMTRMPRRWHIRYDAL